MTEYSLLNKQTERVSYNASEYKVVIKGFDTGKSNVVADKLVEVVLYRIEPRLWGLFSSRKKVMVTSERCSVGTMNETIDELVNSAQKKARENSEAIAKFDN